MTQSNHALAGEIFPAGKCRVAVRGLSASNLRSTMRLKAIAHVRAQTIAAMINPNARQPGQPRFPRAATTIAASANGSAKTVCEKRTNEAHLLIKENIQHLTFNAQHRRVSQPCWRGGDRDLMA